MKVLGWWFCVVGGFGFGWVWLVLWFCVVLRGFGVWWFCVNIGLGGGLSFVWFTVFCVGLCNIVSYVAVVDGEFAVGAWCSFAGG